MPTFITLLEVKQCVRKEASPGQCISLEALLSRIWCGNQPPDALGERNTYGSERHHYHHFSTAPSRLPPEDFCGVDRPLDDALSLPV